ncbi:MAG TPA: hypothetical protein VG733_03290 [Chthoniobacteraceae bacterium]|nr:hypothetical protein [Chthoniobacteraceae bacterium]
MIFYSVKTKTSVVVACMLAMGACVSSAQEIHPSRAEFAAALGRVKKGMTADEVLKLLGKPDDIDTNRDPTVFDVYEFEVWGYGTDGHLSFPTLGSVTMLEGRVRGVFGGTGTPPAPAMFDEKELRNLLQVIDSAQGAGAYARMWNATPLRLIQIVNTLEPLGKEKAMAALNEYLRVSPHDLYLLHDDLHVFLLLRLLYDVPVDTGFMPSIYDGKLGYGYPDDPKVFPLFPLAMVDGIPFNLVNEPGRGAIRKPVGAQMAYFQSNGKWRGHPLMPSNDPLGALDKLAASPEWKLSGPGPGQRKQLLANEILQSIDSIYRTEPDDDGNRLPGDDFDEKRWEQIEKDVAALHIKWDAAKNIYVRGDGTSLPPERKPLYQRQIWYVDSLGPDARVDVERKNKNTVSIRLSRTEHPEAPIPATVVKVYRDDNNQVLAEFDVAASHGQSMGTSGGQTVKLPEGASLHAEYTSDSKTTKTDSFTP